MLALLLRAETRSPAIGIAAVLFGLLGGGVTVSAAETTEPTPGWTQSTDESFLTRYCIACHSGETPDGGFDLSRFSRDLTDEAVFARWVRSYDRVVRREMPPRDADQPSAAERGAVMRTLGEALTAAHRAEKGTVLRRLNRHEYENTLNDLFGTNLDLAELLPADGRAHEFDTVGSALGISMVQLQRYMEGIDAVLTKAIVGTIGPPEKKVVRASYAEMRGAENFLGKQWLKLEDGAVVFFKRYGYPSGMLREANVRQDGWYNVRVTGYAHQSDRPITFALGATTFERGVETPTFGYYELPPGEPSTIEVRAYIKARYMIEVTPIGLHDIGNEIRKNGVARYQGPGLAIQHIEVEGPLTDEYPSRGHRLLFDGLSRSEVMPRNPRDREKAYYKPRFEIKTDTPARAVLPVLQRVATAAFRRPVEVEQIAPYGELFETQLNAGASIEESLRTAVTAIFCAPEFVYLQEQPGRLDDYALASRLAYFLTRSAPDAELLMAAKEGRLTRDPNSLLQQTERLLNDPHYTRFVADFTDAWLNLREIEFTNPDDQLFPEFDRALQHAMVDETRAFWQELVKRNLAVVNVVQSDFAMLNERLALHYEIPGVQGPKIRPVQLSADSLRGGFLTQGAVLKVSANGTNTSPVVRGVWVMERILGQPPPPPPAGIPAVEPDIRGATTLREQLDRHRNVESCRGCHQMIDPPGFALECFDPIGGYRERFRSLGEGDKVNLEFDGIRVRYRLGQPVDASGQLPTGEVFTGFAEFRTLLSRHPDVLARSLVTKLLTFSAGREMGFSDRAEIE
ncbi:MAG: DUF1592 domain-containing protein, partial [Planctomycetaceae bacterium]